MTSKPPPKYSRLKYNIYFLLSAIIWGLSLMGYGVLVSALCGLSGICDSRASSIYLLKPMMVILGFVAISVMFRILQFDLYVGRLNDIGNTDEKPQFWRWMFSFDMSRTLRVMFTPSQEQ